MARICAMWGLRVVVGCGLVYLLSVGQAVPVQAQSYLPDGTEYDPEEFYVCQQVGGWHESGTYLEYDPAVCQILLFETYDDGLGGEAVRSQYWQMMTSVSSDVYERQRSDSLLIPSTLVSGVTLECDYSYFVNDGGDSFTGAFSAIVSGNSVYGPSGGGSLSSAGSYIIDFTRVTGRDWNFYLIGTDPLSNNPIYAELSAHVDSPNESVNQSLQCRVTGWTDDVDDPDPFEPPIYEPPGFSIDPIDWTPIDWQPIIIPSRTTTIEFGIDEPEVAVCNEIIPNTQREVSWMFGTYTVGFQEVEVCTQERSVSLVVDEFDIGGIVTGLLSLLGAGGLFALLKRG